MTDNRVATQEINNLNIIEPAPDDILGTSERERGCMGIRRNAEISCVKAQEVGDGHKSATKDGEDNTTSPEQRTVSLNMRPLEQRDPG